MQKPLIKISPSLIGFLLECPRCLWLYFHEELKRPSGPFPSLPGGLDLLFKDYFDGFRKQGKLPPELEGRISERLFDDMEKLNIWRNNRRGLEAEFPEYEILLKGAIDDLLVNDKGEFVVIDFKTRGFPVKEDTHKHYQNQLDLYSLLFKRNGYDVADYGYLLFFWPREYKKLQARFEVELIKLDISPKKGLEVLKEVNGIMRNEIPDAHSDCEFCRYRNFNE